MNKLISVISVSLLVAVLILPTTISAQSKGLDREAAQHQRSKNVAIVVGVEQYDEASSGLSRLDYAADDAVKLATVFSQNHYTVKRLIDHQAGKHQILSAIRNTAHLIDPQNSTLVFSFSGHGFAQNNQNYLMVNGSTTDHLQGSALKLDDVITALRSTKAERIVIFIDACREISGQKSRSKGFTPQNGQGVQILLSTAFGGLSWESPKLQQGVFSHFLARGLQGEASRGDGIIEFNDLAHYVETNVKDWSFKNLNKVQQPFHRSVGELFGRFVIAARGRFRDPTEEQQNALAKAKAEAEKRKQQEAERLRLQAETDRRKKQEAERLRLQAETDRRKKQEAEKRRSQAEAATLQVPRSATPSSATSRTVFGGFIDNGNGTVTQTQLLNKGLMWKKCLEGQRLAGTRCIGQPTKYIWNALARKITTHRYANHANWRLPTIEELQSLVVCGNGLSALEIREDGCIGNSGNKKFRIPTINTNLFPGTWGRVWSSTEVPEYKKSTSFLLDFNSGYGDGYDKKSSATVRLVRDL